MAAQTSSHFPALTYHGGPPGWAMQRMFVVSLVIHVLLIGTLSGLRISKMERPLASYQVSLVTMPVTPHVEPVVEPKPVEPEPPKAAQAPPVPRPPQPQIVKEKLMPQPVRLPPAPQPRPVRPAPPAPATQPRVEAPAPVAQPTPPAPPPIPARVPIVPSLPVPRPVTINRDALRGIALPPEVPKFTDMQVPAGTPKDVRSQTSNEVEKLLNNLTVPERAAPPPPSADPAPQAPPQARRASVTEDAELKKQLQKLREPIPLPPPAPSRLSEPVVASKPPAQKAPTTHVQMAGVAAGNPYLGLIQKRISNQWIAPQVDLSGSALQVIIRFRLNKSGQVADIVVEQSSGNEYYDMAAKRAVMAASPLPAFPPDMVQAFFDAHFSFSVGEQVS